MGRKRPVSRRGRKPLLALAACALAAGSALPAAPDASASDGKPGCISTPEAYREAWEAREVHCVAPSLFATTHARSGTSLYPGGFRYAWAGSHTNLEHYLKLRQRYGDTPAKVGIGILSYVGYPGLTTWSTPTDLAVYTLPRGFRAQVPAFETWFRLLDEESGDTGAYPLAGQTRLAYAYSRLGPHQDVVDAFQSVTGCNRTALLQGEDVSAEIGCNTAFLEALAAAGPSPYTTGDSASCFRNFATRYKGPKNAAALRGVLYQCQDAGFLNTGVGIGYNTYANPFVCKPARDQSVLQRYTGREFIVPNSTFDRLPSHVDIALDLGEPSQRGFLDSGYC
ncbi:hypothetical protein ACIQZO_09170 [Streptomyces sp. NPDC097617]|uniref:hypothetical protein n=1 Tax=Streptomyces sp. NPDC097617 TaxID=3366091 RepID=UPI0038029D63